MESTFVGLATIVVGIALGFGGHRGFFRFLMVVLGFVAGFLLGGSGITLVTKQPFPGGLWGWVAAVVAGLVLAGLSWPFYSAAVAILGGAVAYLITSGLMVWLGLGTGIVTQVAGIVAAAVLITVIYLLRVHRIVVILVTAAAGAAVIVVGALILLQLLTVSALSATDPTAPMRASPIWPLIVVVLALAGVGAQWRIRSRAPKPAPAVVAPAATASPPAAAPPAAAPAAEATDAPREPSSEPPPQSAEASSES